MLLQAGKQPLASESSIASRIPRSQGAAAGFPPVAASKGCWGAGGVKEGSDMLEVRCWMAAIGRRVLGEKARAVNRLIRQVCSVDCFPVQEGRH